MYKVERIGDSRVNLEFSGKLTGDDMRSLLDELIAASDDMKDGVLFYRISGFEFPELQALAVELTYLPDLFGLIGKFKRCAVVADAGWIQTISEIEGVLIPGLEIRAFDPDQEDDAEKWLSEE